MRGAQVALSRILPYVVAILYIARFEPPKASHLVGKSPSGRMCDILLHYRRGCAYHPAVFRARSDQFAHSGGLIAAPYLIKRSRADIAHRLFPVFLFQTIAGIYIAIGVYEEIGGAGLAWEQTRAPLDIVDQAHIEESSEPALGMFFLELPFYDLSEVVDHPLAVGDGIVALVEIVGIVESGGSKFQSKRARKLIELEHIAGIVV